MTVKFNTLTLLATSIFCAGCSNTGRKGSITPIIFEGVKAKQVVNIAYSRTNDWHVVEDPDTTPFGPIILRRIQILSPPKDSIWQAGGYGESKTCYWRGKKFPYVGRYFREGNIILASGYHPVIMDDDHDVTHKIVQSNEDFAKTHDGYDRQKRDMYYTQPGNVCHLRLFPLTQSQKKNKDREHKHVNHGVLLYLLNDAPGLWRQLKIQWFCSDKDRSAINLVYRSMLEIVKTHDLQWPDYKWSDENKILFYWFRTCAEEKSK